MSTHTVIAQMGPEAAELINIVARIDSSRAATAIGILVVGYLADQFARFAASKLEPMLTGRRNLVRKMTSFTRLGVFLSAGYLALTTLLAGQETALIGVAGTMGVALGFALKDMAGSIVAGVLILVDRPFKVGDRVQFRGLYGDIEEIGLRAVVLRTLAREWYSIPNNRFLDEVVVSANAGRVEMMAAIEFYVGVAEDWELARKIVERACATSRYVHLGEPIEVLVNEVANDGAYTTVITCKAYVIDARFENVYRTDVTRRVKRAFLEHRIACPYGREYIVQTPEWEPAEVHP